MYAVEMGSGSIIYIKSLMKIGTGVQAILKFCLTDLKGRNVGITEGNNLCYTSLKWSQVE
jgi:hypothetical protein